MIKRGFVVLVLMAAMFSNPAFGQAQQLAHVRVLHASPDAPPVDVYIDGKKQMEGVPFKQTSSYFNVPAGDHMITIFAAGDDPAETPVIEETLLVEAGKNYTAAVVDEVDAIHLVVLEDEQEVNRGGAAKLRAVHLSPDTPAVQLHLSAANVDMPSLSFENASRYIDLPAGTYDLDIRMVETDDVATEGNRLQVKEGTAYTAIVVGLQRGEPEFEVVLLTDTK